MRISLPLLALVFVFGCSGNNPGKGAGGSGGTGGGAGSGGSGGSGSGPGDGGVTVSGDTVTIEMASFPVASGAEVYKCQTFANPFAGADAEIGTFHSTMTTGSHHMLMLYQDAATDGPLVDCSGLTFGPMAMGSQQPDETITYPTGIAALIKGTQGFNIVAHYLNATPNEITARVTIVMTKAASGTITQHAGVFFLNNVSALLPGAGGGIPAHTEKTITASYTTTQPMNIINAVGHMHQRSLSLLATYGTTTLYQTSSWNAAPFTTYAPAVQLPTGTTITWACDINNDTDMTLVFGESAQTNQMCIFDGQYYPADDNNPSIDIMR